VLIALHSIEKKESSMQYTELLVTNYIPQLTYSIHKPTLCSVSLSWFDIHNLLCHFIHVKQGDRDFFFLLEGNMKSSFSVSFKCSDLTFPG